MKEQIHPPYQKCTITCACGNVIETGSTKNDYKIDICSSCHPFFLGSSGQKLIDAAGRIERFKQKYEQPGRRQGRH